MQLFTYSKCARHCVVSQFASKMEVCTALCVYSVMYKKLDLYVIYDEFSAIVILLQNILLHI